MSKREQRWRAWVGDRWRSVVLLIGSLAVLSLLGGIAVADGEIVHSPPDLTPVRADEPESPRWKPAAGPGNLRREKMDGALAIVADAALASGDEAALAWSQASGIAVSSGMVRVLVESANPDLTNARTAILAAGGTIEAEYTDTIQALVPPSGLDAIAASPDVRFVRAPAGTAPDQGPGRPSGASPG